MNNISYVDGYLKPGINKGDQPNIPLSSKIWKNPPCRAKPDPHPPNEPRPQGFRVFRVNFGDFSEFPWFNYDYSEIALEKDLIALKKELLLEFIVSLWSRVSGQ